MRNLDVTRDEELDRPRWRWIARCTPPVACWTAPSTSSPRASRYEGLLKAFGPIDVPGYFELRDKVLRLKALADADGFDKVPSHNDFFPPNFLVDKDGKISLIDWEYAGMSDMAADFGTMTVCTAEMPRERAAAALEYYLGHAPSERETRHFFAYEVFAGWCWYLWALVKEAEGDDVGEWLYIYYSHATHTLDSLLAAYAGRLEPSDAPRKVNWHENSAPRQAYGIFSGALWGLDTVVLASRYPAPSPTSAGQALTGERMPPRRSSAVILLTYMAVRGRLRDTSAAVRTRPGKSVIVAALLGGPIGMSGYLIAIDNIGPGLTAIISTFYPALGTLLAFILLKERMAPRQIAALLVALAAIVATGWSATSEPIEGGNAILGVIGALACVIGWGSEAVILTWGMRDEAVDNEVALQIRETTSAVVYLFIVAPIAGVFGFTLHSLAHLSAGVVALAGLAGTASYLYYYKALSAIGASRGMALNISYSAWAIIFALVLQGTVPTATQVVCCVVILVGTVLAATPSWGDLLPRRAEKVSGQ